MYWSLFRSLVVCHRSCFVEHLIFVVVVWGNRLERCMFSQLTFLSTKYVMLLQYNRCSLLWFQHLRDRLLIRHQSHKIDISFCKHWHIHPCKAKVIISGFGWWKKSIPLFPMVEIGSLFVITQSDSYATFQRLQGKVICLLRTESDLGKPAPGWSVHSVRDN